MTVRELIEKLQAVNPKAIVLEYNHDDSAWFEAIDVGAVRNVSLYKDGEFVETSGNFVFLTTEID